MGARPARLRTPGRGRPPGQARVPAVVPEGRANIPGKGPSEEEAFGSVFHGRLRKGCSQEAGAAPGEGGSRVGGLLSSSQLHAWGGRSVGGDNAGHSCRDTLGKKSGRAQSCRREMRAPDTGLRGAATVAARWPEIGWAAEQNSSLGLIPQPQGRAQGARPEGRCRHATERGVETALCPGDRS